jgi:hypothetical protein
MTVCHSGDTDFFMPAVRHVWINVERTTSNYLQLSVYGVILRFCIEGCTFHIKCQLPDIFCHSYADDPLAQLLTLKDTKNCIPSSLPKISDGMDSEIWGNCKLRFSPAVSQSGLQETVGPKSFNSIISLDLFSRVQIKSKVQIETGSECARSDVFIIGNVNQLVSNIESK